MDISFFIFFKKKLFWKDCLRKQFPRLNNQCFVLVGWVFCFLFFFVSCSLIRSRSTNEAKLMDGTGRLWILKYTKRQQKENRKSYPKWNMKKLKIIFEAYLYCSVFVLYWWMDNVSKANVIFLIHFGIDYFCSKRNSPGRKWIPLTDKSDR